MVKVLMVANSDWMFYNFRLPLVEALLKQGHEVVLICPLEKYAAELRQSGCRCIHWTLSRHGLNPLQEVVAAFNLLKIYQRERPDVVHHFTIKPNLYGSLAARLVRLTTPQLSQQPTPAIVNTFMGLGFVFSPHPIAWLLRLFVLPLLWLALRLPNLWAVFLNRQDLSKFTQLQLVSPDQALLIVSDGVDVQRFRPSSRSRSAKPMTPVVLMASRMLWDKGVGVFVESAKLLQKRGVRVQCWLAGEPDLGNPLCVSSAKLQEWQRDGLIHWLGHRADMPDLLKQVNIAVLPSYYNEGVPRILLEAAAAGLPLVATDIEGCRLVVRPGVNGLLVPVRDSQALSIAIEQLVSNSHLCQKMGRASQQIAIEEFDEQKILRQWLAFYDRLLKDRATPTPAYCPP
jgi:glycosyltransferase involved in cell wall biosynthesis